MDIKGAFDAAIEAEKQDLRGLYPMAARVLAAEAKNLIANLENERKHVADMREGVRLGGELAELIGFIKPAMENITSTRNFRDPADHANSAIATAEVILQKISEVV